MPKVGFRTLSTNQAITVKNKGAKPEGIELEFTWNHAVKDAPTKGAIDLEIEAGDRYTNSIPFSVLSGIP
jgi:hypothetical protein